MSANPAFVDWLSRIWWREAWLTIEALEPATLPPWLGSGIRGALGHLFRSALCDGAGCGHDCQRPGSCRYYSLFEAKREGAKPFVLMAPPLPGLEAIAMGGPVHLPFRTGPPRSGETIPTLLCEAGWKLSPGAALRFGLRLFGELSNVLPAAIEGIAKFGLDLGGYRFRLASAHDHSGQLLYDCKFSSVPVQMPRSEKLLCEPEKVRRLRVVFLTPVLFKPKNQQTPTFSPNVFAARFFEHSLGTAVKIYQVCSGEKLPWVDPPCLDCGLIAHKLFRYDLPRHSYRQDKWLDFDGVIGYMDFAGELDAAMPWARAAEVMHFGQKAAFGQGAVRVIVLE
ncbi:MAG: CRISPR system precrRNA processing endoribonuclease RAMP protein Cas6 [Bryobacteraceae bacterium]